MTDTRIAEIIAIDSLEEALSAVDAVLADNPADDSAYYCRGRVLWKHGHRAEALSAYSKAVKINPESPGRHALQMGRDVFDFFNPDLLNP